MSQTGTTAKQVDMKLEVDVIPVSDVERSKQFYGRLGWRLDADDAPAKDIRIHVDSSLATLVEWIQRHSSGSLRAVSIGALVRRVL